MTLDPDTRAGAGAWLKRRLRQPGLAGMVVLVAFVTVISGRDTERLGDGFQIALPVLALGCAIADGRGVQFAGRLLLLEVAVRTPKLTLGDQPWAQRPGGKPQGMPSGHTAFAAFGAASLATQCLQNSRSAQALAIMAAGFTGTSRVDADKHTIWQVLAGALLGWLIQALSLSAFDTAFRRLWTGFGRQIARLRN